MFKSILSTIPLLFAVTDACIDVHAEADVRSLSTIDPYTFPDTLAYLDSVNSVVESVYITVSSGKLIHVNYVNSTGSHSLQTRVPWRINLELIVTCKDFAYVFLLTSKSYETMTRKAIASLRRYDRFTPIVLMVHNRIGSVDIQTHNLELYPIRTLKNAGRYQWRDTFAKFEIAALTQYDRVMFFDSDVMFCNSPQRYFYVNPESELMAPYAYWFGSNLHPVFTSGGPFVANPSETLFYEARNEQLGKTYDGEMDYVNEVLYNEIAPLDNQSFVLVGEFYPNDAVYSVYGEKKWYEHTMIHFVADWKPPMAEARLRTMPNSIQEIYKQWDRYA